MEPAPAGGTVGGNKLPFWAIKSAEKWKFVVSTPRAQRAEFGAPVEGRYKIDRGGAALAAEPRVIHPSIGTPEGWHKVWYYIAGLSLSVFYQ